MPVSSLLSRFIVTEIGINKDGMPVQHESLAVMVYDKDTFKTLEFLIQRVPSKLSYSSRFSYFCQEGESVAVLESIKKAIRSMRSLTQSADSISDAIDNEAIPLLLLREEASSEDASREVDPPPLPSPPPPSKPMSLKDIITTSLVSSASAARMVSRSISPQNMAYDSIQTCPPNTIKLNSCIRLFKPQELSLFDLVLLAKVVNTYAPIYGLFDNHCYMFASVIFDAVVQLFSHTQTPGIIPAPSPETSPPRNANRLVLPISQDATDQSAAGHWAGLLVLDPIVKSTIVKIIMTHFVTERKSFLDEASRRRRS